MEVARSSPSTLKKLVDVTPSHLPPFPSVTQAISQNFLQSTSFICSTGLPSSHRPNIALLGATLVNTLLFNEVHCWCQWVFVQCPLCCSFPASSVNHCSHPIRRSGWFGLNLFLFICFKEEDAMSVKKNSTFITTPEMLWNISALIENDLLITLGKDFLMVWTQSFWSAASLNVKRLIMSLFKKKN